jgi:hypothetical protein
LVELPGIEPGVKIALNCEDAGLAYAKRRQTTCGYAGGVDGINKVDTAILFPTDGIACYVRCAAWTPVETSS